jgi:hypothetical protein
MTTQLPSRERSDPDIHPDWRLPEVLFEEARRRRHRRWMAGSVLATAAISTAALILGMAGGGGGGAGSTADGQPSGSGSGAASGHAAASHLFPGAPSTEGFYTGPGASCPLAPRSRYLPAWSGCVSSMLADVSGSGRRELVLTYSRLSHKSLASLPRLGKVPTRYPAEQAMLRIVSPDGDIITTPIGYTIASTKSFAGGPQKAYAAALISVAHTSDEPGEQMFLEVQHISSGSTAVAYSLYRGHLVPSGALLGYGGDSGSQSGFECVAGNPPRLLQHTYELIRGIKTVGNTVHIYGWWNVTTATYAWHGPRLTQIAQSTVERRVLPRDSVGAGCIKGIA